MIILNEKYEFFLPDLPYAYNSLEPYIDEETMYLHHDKHFKKYIDNLNEIIRKNPTLKNLTLIEILMFPEILPPNIRQEILNNAGGIYNHYLYFNILSNNNNDPGDYEIYYKIEEEFGSFDRFYKIFSDAANSVFGSGYAFLVIDNDRKLHIVTKKNQDTPLKDNLYPLILIDVWEHAYYLKYKNRRDEYVKNFRNIINFEEVNNRYLKFVK